MNSYLEYLCSKIRLRWLGANHYEVKPIEDDDFEATLKEMQEAGWRLVSRKECSALLDWYGQETVIIERAE